MAISNDGEHGDAWAVPLTEASAYPHPVDGPIVVHETHISRVYLAGKYAYKIKKPVVTDFLDYGTLEKRHHACCEELRLGRRYSEGIYLDVVPISIDHGRLVVDGDSAPIEFAVRMRRFPDDALLSQQLPRGLVLAADMQQLAETIARIHQNASPLRTNQHSFLPSLQHRAQENFDAMAREPGEDWAASLCSELEGWTRDTFLRLADRFRARLEEGWVRECHGDLHCNNIVLWHDHWVPFDGIEFNPEFSWIDVMNDLAFLVMDLHARAHADLAHGLLNAYLEHTGDYQGLRLLRWYMVYRAMVRAKVAVLREHQIDSASEMHRQVMNEAANYLRLAQRLSRGEGKPTLWITHGLSGSGKSTGAQRLVNASGMIRIRSDVERKRLFKSAAASTRVGEPLEHGIYTANASDATYARLRELASDILASGYSVIVDATFLKRAQRQPFQDLALALDAEFRILHFEAEAATLRARIAERSARGHDPSDADARVLEHQIRTQEPLAEPERRYVTRYSQEDGEPAL